MTKTEKKLLQDLVDISISAQKVLEGIVVPLDKAGEAVLLRAMTANVLNTYTKVKPELKEGNVRGKSND